MIYDNYLVIQTGPQVGELRLRPFRGLLATNGQSPGVKAQPHAAMLYTRDGTIQGPRDTSKSHAMCCDVFSNMLEFLLPILEYLSHLSFDSQTVFSMMMSM